MCILYQAGNTVKGWEKIFLVVPDEHGGVKNMVGSGLELTLFL